jgi:hypothetical protein
MRLAPAGSLTVRLKAPLMCMNEHTVGKALLVESGPHKSAYCPKCRTWIKHLAPADLLPEPPTVVRAWDLGEPGGDFYVVGAASAGGVYEVVGVADDTADVLRLIALYAGPECERFVRDKVAN